MNMVSPSSHWHLLLSSVRLGRHKQLQFYVICNLHNQYAQRLIQTSNTMMYRLYDLPFLKWITKKQQNHIRSLAFLKLSSISAKLSHHVLPDPLSTCHFFKNNQLPNLLGHDLSTIPFEPNEQLNGLVSSDHSTAYAVIWFLAQSKFYLIHPYGSFVLCT